MTSTAAVYQRTAKSDYNPFGFSEVSQIPDNECCVVYLGGDGAVNNKAANGYAKIIENEILKPLEAKIPVYSIRYDFGDGKKSYARHNLFNKYRMVFSQKLAAKYADKCGPEENNPQYIEALYQKIIEPRISRNGVRIPREDAMRNLRKITFVAHCHGAFTALKLEELMQEKMKELGYTDKERRSIQQQMLVVAHAPACPLGVAKSTFIGFMSAADKEVPQGLNYFSHYINNRMKEESIRYYAEEDANSEKASQNRWFELKPSFFRGKMGNFFLIKQKYAYSDEGPCLINPDEHNDVSYSSETQSKDGKLLMRLSKNIISNGIRNSLLQELKFTPLPPIEKLVLSDCSRPCHDEEEIFAMMEKNGKELEKEIYAAARKMVTSYAVSQKAPSK